MKPTTCCTRPHKPTRGACREEGDCTSTCLLSRASGDVESKAQGDERDQGDPF